MGPRVERGWRSTAHEAKLEWEKPWSYDDFVFMSNAPGHDGHAFFKILDEASGVYLWRVKKLGGLFNVDLYVGQTAKGFGTRTDDHLKRSDLGKKLKTLKEEGKEPFVYFARLYFGTLPRGRDVEECRKMILDSVERALIWELKPTWNQQQNVTARIPLNVSIESIKDVPRGVPSRIIGKAGERHRGI